MSDNKDYDTTVGVQIEALSDAEIQSLTKLEEKLKSIMNLLQQTTNKINSSISSAQKVVNNVSKNITTSVTKATKTANSNLGGLGKTIKRTFSAGNLIYFSNMLRYIGSSFFNGTIKKAVDFTETVNLFGVAMKDAGKDALKFQHTINNSIASSMNTMMNAQATFKTMLSSITSPGISNKQLYGLSETLTKMAMDFSSLYNVSIESALAKYQAALTQQVRPIRSTSGYDITMKTLQETLNDLNIDRAVSSLTQMEKRLLIILSLNKQMANSGAMQDYARTIESPAQQLKVLQNLLEELGRYIGGVFYPLLTKVLPVINGIVWALKEVAKAIATLVGYKPFAEMPKDNPLEDYIGGANEAIDETSKNVDKLKNKVAGFDELNDITPSSSASDVGGIGGDMSISQDILDALGQYDSKLEEVEMKASKIKDNILAWLGFTKQVNEETGEVLYKFTGWKGIDLTPMKNALAYLAPQLSNLWENIKDIFINLYERYLNPLFKWLIEAFFPKVIMLIGAIIEVWNAAYVAMEPIRDIFYELEKEIYKLLGTLIIEFLTVLIELLQEFATWINENPDKFRKLTVIIISFFAAFKTYAVIAKVSASLKGFFTVVTTGIKAVGPMVKGLAGIIPKMIASFKAIGGLKGVIAAVTTAIKGLVAALSGLVSWPALIIAAIAGMFVYCYTQFEGFREFINGLFEDITNYLSGLIGRWAETGKNMIAGLIEGILSFDIFKIIGELFNGLIRFVFDIFGIHSPSTVFADIGRNLMLGLINGIKSLIESVFTLFTSISKKVSETMSKALGSIKDNLNSAVSFVSGAFKNAWSSAWNGIKGIVNTAVSGISNKIGEVKSAMGRMADNVSNKAKEASNTLGNLVGTATSTVKNLTQNALNKVGEAVSNIRLPKFADGGLPRAGSLFIANEKAPEFVGNLGGQTMVANQQQLFSSLTEAFRGMMGQSQGNRPLTVNLTVDGKVLASTTVNNINQMTNQLGYNPLVF